MNSNRRKDAGAHTGASPARALACEIGAEARKRDAYVRELIDARRAGSQLAAEDFAFAQVLAFGVAACRGALDEAIDRSLDSPKDVKPKLRDALRISAYELLFLDKPDYVVVNEGVELAASIAPRARGLANAVLRKMVADAREGAWGEPEDGEGVEPARSRRSAGAGATGGAGAVGGVGAVGGADGGGAGAGAGDHAACSYAVGGNCAAVADRREGSSDGWGFPWGDPTVDDEAFARSFGVPTWLAQTLIAEYGRFAPVASAAFDDPASSPADGCTESVPLRVRPNTAPAPVVASPSPAASAPAPSAAAILAADLEPAPTYLVDNPFLPDDRFAADLSAQQVASLVPVDGTILEIGAGRGTKTMLLQCRSLRERGRTAKLHAVDLHDFKLRLLEERMEAAGIETVETHAGDARDLDALADLPDTFDAALVDAPCSGTGTLRRHPEITWRLAPEDVDSLVELQLSLLTSAAKRVKVGGVLVYATCSILGAENRGLVERFLGSKVGEEFYIDALEEGELLEGMPSASIDAAGCFAVAPSEGGPDGHFAARLRREC